MIRRAFLVRPVYRADSERGGAFGTLEAALEGAAALADERIPCVVAVDDGQTPTMICPGRLARHALALVHGASEGENRPEWAKDAIAKLDRSPVV